MIHSKADEVLKSIERNSWGMYFPIIGPRKGRILLDVIHKIKPKRILEVGTLIGYSTILMAKELGNDAEIITIEIDRDEAEIAEENIKKAEIKPGVRVLVGDALDIIPRLNGSFDMVFLDADKNEYFEYLMLIEDKLHRGCVIIADNTDFHSYSMRRYLDYVRNSGRYESQVDSANRGGMEVSTKL